MAANKYFHIRFLMSYKETETEVYPIHSDGISINYNAVQDERYWTKDFNGKLTFLRGYYQTISAQAATVEFVIKVQIRWYNNGWRTVYQGKFTRTDVFFDDDKELAEVELTTDDFTTKVVNSLDKEFDLIKLGVPKTEVEYVKQPLIQVYRRWATRLSNFYQGQSFDTDATPIWSQTELYDNYHFGDVFKFARIQDSGLVPDISGDYLFSNFVPEIRDDSDYSFSYAPGETARFFTESNALDDFNDFDAQYDDDAGNRYEIKGVYEDVENSRFIVLAKNISGAFAIPDTGNLTWVSGGTNQTTIAYFSTEGNGGVPFYRRARVIDENTGDDVYLSHTIQDTKNYSGNPEEPTPYMETDEIELFSVTTDSKTVIKYGHFYGRMLTDVLTGSDLEDKPGDDISNALYRKIKPLDLDGNLFDSDEKLVSTDSSDATGGDFGQYPSNSIINPSEYYTEPNNGDINLPLYRSDWANNSMWLRLTPFYQLYFTTHRTKVRLRDAYLFSDVFSAIMGAIDPGLSHGATTDYSRFLYSTNNPITGILNRQIAITQKSNMLAGNYDTAASRVKLKLKDALVFFRNALNVYWDVDYSGRLRLEHDLFYYNGGEYGGQVTSQDLTTLECPSNGKKWVFGTGKRRFRKQEIPEQIKTTWMDQVSDLFTGVPIELTDPYVDFGNIKENNIGQFTSDVEFMLANTGDISKNGFAVFEVQGDQVPFTTFDIGNSPKKIQNGGLSMTLLHDRYWVQLLPSKRAKVNGNDIVTEKVARNMEQEISLPGNQLDIDLTKLVQTQYGKGKPENAELEIIKNKLKMTIYHDTE